ncbi:MAG: hypothetical protein KAS66_14420, partial [Candidatus Omnitrophica bacterium]|nr:hypothetical protein [Candidatus Omnitrophota bacterium]
MTYIYELCERLPRCGPGDNESTRRAYESILEVPKNPEGAEFHGFQSVGEWGFARRASSEARSEELSSATDFSPWVSTRLPPTRFKCNLKN